MKTRIGIVGPQDSVSTISEIAKAYTDQITVVPVIYKQIEDLTELIPTAEQNIDVWCFTGRVPYGFASENHLIRINAFYPELNGSSLTGTLLEIAYKDLIKLERLSLDTLAESEIYETFKEIHLPTDGLYLNPYKNYTSHRELVEFHYSLYKENKVNACITTIGSVFKELKARNIPVYRLSPTSMAIRQALNMARSTGETIHFKKSQIAIQIIHIDDLNKLVNENTLSYDVHRLDLKIQESILNYTEAIYGSLITAGKGTYFIFSTRGSMEDNPTDHPTLLLEKISLLTDLTINIGIGYGMNSLTAEQNARIGLSHAKKYGSNCVIQVNENGSIDGPLNNPNPLTYRFRTEDKELSDRLRNCGVNISTYNKLLTVQNHFGIITSTNVSERLSMTQRNARRILMDLEKAGLATIIGEETPSTKGRPRKLYKIGL